MPRRSERDYCRTTGPQLRAWLAHRRLTYAMFAAHIGKSERTIKRYCATEGRLPRIVAVGMRTMPAPARNDGTRSGGRGERLLL